MVKTRLRPHCRRERDLTLSATGCLGVRLLCLLLFPALLKAIATACFCGLPTFISVSIFELMVFVRGSLFEWHDVLHMNLLFRKLSWRLLVPSERGREV